MNILTNRTVPKELFDLCMDALNDARRKAARFMGNDSPAIKPSSVMVTGVAASSAQCVKLMSDVQDSLYKILSRMYVKSTDFDPMVKGSGPRMDYIKETHKHVVPITKGAANNVAICRVLVCGITYQGFDIDIVLTMHVYKLFRQTSFALDIVIEDEH